MRVRIVFATALIVIVTGFVLLLANFFVHATSTGTLRRAGVVLQMGEPERARDTLRWLRWFDPGNDKANRLISMTYLHESNYPDAIRYLSLIPEGSPFHNDAQSDLAAALIADRQWEKAESVLRQYLQQHPEALPQVRQLSGLLLSELRRREAVQLLKNYLSQAEETNLSLDHRLLILRELSSAEFHPPTVEDCLPSLEESHRRYEEQPHILLALGICYHENGDSDSAKQALLIAADKLHGEIDAQLALCEFLTDHGHDTEVEAKLNELEHISDDRLWNLRSRIAERQSQHEIALACVEQAIRIIPADKEYEARRARLLQKLRRVEAAQAAYARSYALGKAELELWNLSRECGMRLPTRLECSRMADLYESLGRKLQSRAWRKLSLQLEVTLPDS